MKRAITYLAGAILAILGASYYYVESGAYALDIEKCGAEPMLVLDSSVKVCEVLYFGESSNVTCGGNDSSKESISAIAARLSRQKCIAPIVKGGLHAGTYKALIARLGPSQVKTMIVTMNLRSFNVDWMEEKLETTQARAIIMYGKYPPILKRFLLDFKAYDSKDSIMRMRSVKRHYKTDVLFSEPGKFKNVQQWDAFMFSKGHVNPDGSRNAEKCALACHFIKNYAFVLDENNQRVRDFDAIADMCREKNIRLILNLLPENVERARELCGDDLLFLMDRNAEYLQKRYKDKALFINNLHLVPDSCFLDRSWPTEHYDYHGRSRIAKRLAEKI